MRNTKIKALLCALTLLCCPAARADVLTESGYTEIMQALVGQMQDILFGIMVEDYGQVATLAEAIAYHPEPAVGQQMALLRKMEMDGSAFTIHEDRIRQNALKLMAAANDSDREEVVDRFADLAGSCTECHASYRDKVRRLVKQR